MTVIRYVLRYSTYGVGTSICDELQNFLHHLGSDNSPSLVSVLLYLYQLWCPVSSPIVNFQSTDRLSL